MVAWRWKRDCPANVNWRRLNISRTTVASALSFGEEGYLYSRQGSGSRIALPERPVEARKTGPAIGESGRCRP
jgi:hypothetical protein